QFIDKNMENEFKIRISSLDSNEIPDALIHYLKGSRIVQPHFHIPLQSGSFNVLKRMKRRYSPDQFLTVVEKLRKALPEACLGADVIVGFPGETEEEFEECFNFISRTPLDYLHVFPFSPRTGTPAQTMPDQVPNALKKQRVKNLKTLSDNRRKQFARQFNGETRTGILIYPDLVLTDNYISVHLETITEILPGSEVRVKLTQFTPQGSVHGTLV
ncbi:MAG: radical SAM protein, partial [Holophagae bacterium]|nr:radical SAM protein [Holophagae bacterium]